MLTPSLQRRAFGVELWALIPTHGDADEIYFVRVHDKGHIDHHFTDATAALDEFFRRVREAMRAD